MSSRSSTGPSGPDRRDHCAARSWPSPFPEGTERCVAAPSPPAGQPYSLLDVRIAEPSAHRPVTDLTARARIRDAAIECFAEEGFGAGFRAIAARAGVSPGLITHHFGSKTALRATCDAEVLRQYRAVKEGALERPSGHVLENLAAPGVPATLLVYLLRAIHAGGPPPRSSSTAWWTTCAR